MTIHLNGSAHRVLDDFIYYATTYPGRLSDAMWWCEDTFVEHLRHLKEAYDEAVTAGSRCKCPYCGG